MGKFSWGVSDIKVIETNKLICKTCRRKQQQAGICEAFPGGKPTEIIQGGDYCAKYLQLPE